MVVKWHTFIEIASLLIAKIGRSLNINSVAFKFKFPLSFKICESICSIIQFKLERFRNIVVMKRIIEWSSSIGNKVFANLFLNFNMNKVSISAIQCGLSSLRCLRSKQPSHANSELSSSISQPLPFDSLMMHNLWLGNIESKQ